MKKFILISTIIISTIFSTGCTKWELVKGVSSVAIDKQYEASYTTSSVAPMRIGKSTVMMPRTIRHPEKNVVVLEYDSLQTSVDNKEFYNTVEIGDIIEVNLYSKKDKRKIKYEQ